MKLVERVCPSALVTVTVANMYAITCAELFGSHGADIGVAWVQVKVYGECPPVAFAVT